MLLVLLSSNIFHTNLLIFLKIQTIIKSHLLMMGASNLAVLIFATCFFHTKQHFPYKPPYFFKNSDYHKISSFNDGGLKFGRFDIRDMLFPFPTFVKL